MKANEAGLGKRLDICAERAGGKKALAVTCDISVPQLFRYFKGEAVLPTDRLVAIARAANVHPYWLLTGEGSPDIPPIQSFVSGEQVLTIDAKSLTESIAMADRLDQEYGFKLTPERKAEFVFALYSGASYESKIYGKPIIFESSKALEVYGYLSAIQGELPRRMLINTIDIITKASANLLPEKEIRTFCNYLNTAFKEHYNQPTLAQPYFDRIGYRLELDTVNYVDALVKEVKQEHMLREEPVKILDLGCGNGRHLLHFAGDPRIKAIGIDNNRLSKQLCTDYENAGKLAAGSFVEGEIHNLPFKPNSFDLVFANATIFNTPFFADSPHGLNNLFNEVRRVLRPTGVMYIHSRYGNGFEPFPFFQLHNEGSIRQLCQKNNFEMKWFKKFSWQDSIEYIPKSMFNAWFSTLLVKS